MRDSKHKTTPNAAEHGHASPAIAAEIMAPSQDIRDDLPFFTGKLGFRLDQIFPADDPAVAVVSGHGVRLRLDVAYKGPAPHLSLLADDPDMVADGERRLTAPNGMVIDIDQKDPPMVMPTTLHNIVVRRLADQAPWVIGRAGMHYRDLIPDRLGGSIIASHIRIPEGGPVPDMVHYHTVGFQLIFCIQGWVDLVYEDQGEPFRLFAGDCVIQPPEIRHQVLYSGDDLEVLEIGVPAEHITTIDHEMSLPNGPANPDRLFSGQRFVHHKEQEASWADWRLPGFVFRETGIADATNNVASVHVAKWQGTASDQILSEHDSDILFAFVKTGGMDLAIDDASYQLTAGDAFVVPPHTKYELKNVSNDIEIIEVSLPGAFTTSVHDA